MIFTDEYYKDIEVEGVTIVSRRGMQGNKEHGIMEVIEIIGSKEGEYKGKNGRWRKGNYYNPEKFSYPKAMKHWQKNNLHKFNEVTNAA